MSNKFQITKARLAEIVREEYASILEEMEQQSPTSRPVPQSPHKESVDFIKEMIKQQLQSL